MSEEGSQSEVVAESATLNVMDAEVASSIEAAADAGTDGKASPLDAITDIEGQGDANVFRDGGQPTGDGLAGLDDAGVGDDVQGPKGVFEANMDGTPIWTRKRSSEEEASPPPGTLEESEGDVAPVFVAENVRESTPEPETKAAPLGTDSELVTTYRDSASLGSSADEIAEARFGRDVDDLAPDERAYVDAATKADDELAARAAGSDDLAQDILTKRAEVEDAIRRADDVGPTPTRARSGGTLADVVRDVRAGDVDTDAEVSRDTIRDAETPGTEVAPRADDMPDDREVPGGEDTPPGDTPAARTDAEPDTDTPYRAPIVHEDTPYVTRSRDGGTDISDPLPPPVRGDGRSEDDTPDGTPYRAPVTHLDDPYVTRSRDGGTDVSDPLAPPTRPRADVPAEDVPRLERTAGDGPPPTERIYVQPEDIPRIGRTGGGDPPPPERVYVPPEDMPRAERQMGGDPPPPREPERVYVPPEEMPRVEGVDRPPVRADLPTLDPQRIPDRIPLPGETLLAAPVQDEPASRRLPEPPPGAPKPKRFKAAPRPDGAYPQTTGHSEVVGHLWDPSAERITSGRVAMSEPVVTRWGDNPSPIDERDVGGWDLQPTHDGIDAALDEHEVVTVSPVMAHRLRAEAEKRPGEPAVAYEVVSYEHDLPSGVTTPSRRVHVQEEDADDATVGWFEPEVHAEPDAGARRVHTPLRNGTPALNRSPHEGNAALLRAAAQLARAAAKEKPKPRQQRRKSANREEPRRRGFTAPQVVVVQESGTPKRFGL